VITGFGPRGELPSPPLSLSLSLFPSPSPFFSPARPLPPHHAPRRLGLLRRVPARRRLGPPCRTRASRPRAPAPGLAPHSPSRPAAAASRPRAPAPVGLARPRPVAAARPRARRTPCPRRAPPRRPRGPTCPRALCARPCVTSRMTLRLASRQPCALSVLSCAPAWPLVSPACAQRVRARATVVALRGVRLSALSVFQF
jgi:hypothetical protein